MSDNKLIHVGVRLLDGTYIENASFEILANDPVNVQEARIWYNSTIECFKYSKIDEHGDIVIRTFTSKEDLLQAILDLDSEFKDYITDKINELGSIIKYTGVITPGNELLPFDLSTLTDKEVGSYYKIINDGHIKLLDGLTIITVNNNDAIIFNNNGSIDVINNSLTVISGNPNFISVIGNAQTGYVIDLANAYKTKVDNVEEGLSVEIGNRVSAISAVYAHIDSSVENLEIKLGNITNLTTDVKTDAVSAINNLKTEIDNLEIEVSNVHETLDQKIDDSIVIIENELDSKVDKVAGKGLSTEDYTTSEKNKLAGIEANANNYTHPANHSPSIITQDANNRFVTDAEKAIWSGKEDSGTASYLINIHTNDENAHPQYAKIASLGSMAYQNANAVNITGGKATLTFDGSNAPLNIASAGAGTITSLINGDIWHKSDNLYVRLAGYSRVVIHNGTYSTITQAEIEAGTATIVRWMTAQHIRQGTVAWWNSTSDKTKLDGIEANANNYVHPANHSPSIITQDANNRFVTDTEKTTWSGKAELTDITSAINNLKDNVSTDGDTLLKLRNLISGINDVLITDDASYNTIQKITNVIKALDSDLSDIDNSKINISDIINNLTSINTDKPLSALQGKLLKDLIDTLSTVVDSKVDKISGKGLSTEDYTTIEKNKLAGIEANANNYIHPANHSPSIITQDANNRFVTDAEKAIWSGKEEAGTALSLLNIHTSNNDAHTQYAKITSLGTMAYQNADAVNITGGRAVFTFNGTNAPLSLPNTGSVNPTVLNNGDIWHRSSVLYARLNGSTRMILTDSTYSIISQAEIEAGTATSIRWMTAQRIRQATDAWWNASANKTKLDGIEVNANNYVHPANHSPSIILQDADNRFVTDIEKASWTGKAELTDITSAITNLKDGVSTDGDTLAKLRNLITNIETILQSNDVNLDTIQEVVNFIKDHETDITQLGSTKINITDIVDILTSTSTDKPLSAAQGKVLKDLIDSLSTTVNNKVDKIAGKGLSTEDYTTIEKNKLAGIEANANNYTHPANHSPSIITQDANNRFVTDAEKAIWSGKEEAGTALSLLNIHTSNDDAHAQYAKIASLGSMAYQNANAVNITGGRASFTSDGVTSQISLPDIGLADPTSLSDGDIWHRNNVLYIKLSGSTRTIIHNNTYSTMSQAEAEAGVSTSIRWISAQRIRQGAIGWWTSSAEKIKLDGIEANANNYVHPANHSPSIILQDANNRFVTDTEKAIWSGKEDAGTAISLLDTHITEPDAHTQYAKLANLGTMAYQNADTVSITGGRAIFTFNGVNSPLSLPNTGTVDPTSLNNGDIWHRNNEFFIRTNGTTKTIIHSSTYSVIGQAEIEAGTATTVRWMTAQRIRQATDAWWNTSANKTKLDGIAVNANNYVHPTGDGNLHVPANGTANNRKWLMSGATAGTYTWESLLASDIPTLNQNTTGSAASLAAMRSISITGDATWSVNFDGSANVSNAITLSNSGVTAGTYRSVTVNAKGLVTAGTNPTTLAGYGITDAAPSSHVGATGTAHGNATTSVAGFMSSADKTKLDGVATGANNYTHPANHSPSIITQDANNRFVTDAEKAIWSGKENAIAAGTTSEYFRGDKSWRNFAGDVRTTTLTGIVFTDSTAVASTDNILIAAGKIQAKLNTLGTISTQNSNNVSLTGGTITDLTNLTITGSLGVNLPSDSWTTSGMSADSLRLSGILYTNGSYRASWLSNGYRNNAGTWTSLGINTYTGAAAIELDPQGFIYFRTEGNKATGSSKDISLDLAIGPNGNVNIGTSGTPDVTVSLSISKNITGGETAHGLLQEGIVQSGVTSNVFGIRNRLNTAAQSFTINNYYHFHSDQLTKGAGSNINNQFGFFAASNLTSALYNYGFYSDIPDGINRWNFYGNGTAPNYFNGKVRIGTTEITSNSKFNVQGGSVVFSRSSNNILLPPSNTELSLYSFVSTANTGTIQITFHSDTNDRYSAIGTYRGSTSNRIGLSFFTCLGTSVPVETLRLNEDAHLIPTTDIVSNLGQIDLRYANIFSRNLFGVHSNIDNSIIHSPEGGSYVNTVNLRTGAIAVTLPVGYNNAMMTIALRVYNYLTGTSFDVVVAGYNYSISSDWRNTTAYILGDPDVDRSLTVRFGYNSSGKCVIYIGELNTTWSYPQIHILNVTDGYNGRSINYLKDWNISFESTAFENVTSTLLSKQIGYRSTTNTANALVLRDASGNFSANVITANTFSGNASTASSLINTRSISITGDATWSVNFDGSANVAAALTLANSGVTAGTYRSITVNSKGLITAGTNPTTLAGYGITDAAPSSHVGSTGTAHGNATTSVAGFMSSADKTKLDGVATSANNYSHPTSGVTAGTYRSVTVDVNGHVTAGTNPTTLAGYGITDAAPSSHVGSTGTAHGNATTSVAGFMSSADKTKLDGVATGANNYSHPTGDGNLHVPANGTTNNRKWLMSGATAGTYTWENLLASDIPTLNQNTTGSAATLTTARTLTIGSTGKTFNGSANVSWTLAEIGADNASNLVTGTLPNARLSGLYSDISIKINGANTIFTTPNTGSSSDLARTVYGLAEFRSSSGTATGAILFIAPTTLSSIMHHLEISGLLHNVNIIRFIVQGYRTTGTWGSLKKINLGSGSIDVRLGVTPDGKNCVILGDVNTVWAYPHFSLVKALFSHNNASDAYCKDWSVALITDLTGYTNVSAVIPDNDISSNITGSSTSLANARSISITGDATWSINFNGTADATAALTLANSGVTAGTYRSVTVNAKGLITAGTNPTTLAGYGITDAAPSSHVGATGTAHGNATTSVAGFMSSADKTKLDGIATNANNYTHPTSGVTAGTYKSVTVDVNGHVTAGTNPTTLAGYGITDAAPSTHVGATGAAHGNATTSVAGFMSSADKTKLDGVATGANNYSHPTGDGNLHVPANGTTNNRKLLMAGATAGTYTWESLLASDIPTLNQNTTGSAATLTTSRNINGTSFNGSADITTVNWGTARNINKVSINGSLADYYIPTLYGTNGLITLNTSSVTNAVNYLTVQNAITANDVEITTTGTDTNIGLKITTKGTGSISLDTGTSTGDINIRSGLGKFRIWDTNSSHYYQFDLSDITSNYTITLPVGNVVLTAGTSVVTTRNISTGDGLQGGGDLSADRTLSVDSTVVRTTGNQTIAGTKNFTSRILVVNTFDKDGSGPSSQQDGLYIADLGTSSGITLNPTHTAAICAQISTSRSIAVTVDGEGYIYGFRSHSSVNTYTFHSKSRFSDQLTNSRTIALSGAATGTATSFNGSANITIPVTALDANSLTSGTVPDARISGAYSGLTNLGFGMEFGSGPITEFGNIVGGSGYVSGTYNNVLLTGGTGFGAYANITVTAGVVTDVAIYAEGHRFSEGDVLTTSNANLGGTGSGFTVTATKVRRAVININRSISGSDGPRIRLMQNISLVDGDEMGFILFGSYDSSAYGRGDKGRIGFVAEGNGGGARLQVWTAPSSNASALALEVTGTNALRLYNSTSTFYHSITNTATANRTVSLPDGNVVLTAGTMVPTTGTGATGSWAISVTGSAATLTTARTLTIGSTGKTFNGSANVSWTLAEIGADNASNLVTGTLPDARLSGVYTNISVKVNGGNTVFSTPSAGSANDLARTVYGLAEFRSTSATATGAITFIAPTNSNSIMHALEISGMLYDVYTLVKLEVSGYRNGSGSFSYCKKINLGNADIQVRFAIDSSNRTCIILGDVNTVWSYPHISITKALFSHNNITDAYCTGWTTALLTSLTGYTVLTEAINSYNLPTSFLGTSNLYNEAAVEVRGSGVNNTIFPVIGFHQPGLYAGSLQLRASKDFRLYHQDGVEYAGLTVAALIAESATISGNTILGDSTTDTVTVTGNMTVNTIMGIGGAPVSSSGLRVVPTLLTGINQIGVVASPLFTSEATTSCNSIFAQVRTVASVFTIPDAAALYIENSVKGSGSIITTQYGILIKDQTNGVSNFGITSQVSAGTNKWNIYASGTAPSYFADKVRIGTTNLTSISELQVQGAPTTLSRSTSTGISAPADSELNLYSYISTASTGTIQLTFHSDTNTRYSAIGTYRGSTSNRIGLSFFTCLGTDVPVETVRIDENGRLSIGAFAPVTAFINTTAINPFLQNSGTTADQSSYIQSRFTNDINSPIILLAKSRGTTVGSLTTVQNQDSLGRIGGFGSNGTDFREASRIEFYSDGTPSATTMPGGIKFLTTIAGSNTPGERLNITNDGHLLPWLNNTYDLGSSIKMFRSVYSYRLYIPTGGEFGLFNDQNLTEITTLLGGTPYGTYVKGATNGHVAIYLDSNDDSDSFSVVSHTATDLTTSNKTPDLVAFKVSRRGNVTIAGTGLLAATSGDSLLTIGTVGVSGNHRVNIIGGGVGTDYGLYLNSVPAMIKNTSSSSVLRIGSDGTSVTHTTLHLYTAGQIRQTVNSLGYIGIGNNDPVHLLDIYNNSSNFISGNFVNNFAATLSGIRIASNSGADASKRIDIYYAPSDYTAVASWVSSGVIETPAAKSLIFSAYNCTEGIKFQTGLRVEQMRLNLDGVLLINATTPIIAGSTYRLQVNSNVVISNGADYSSYSSLVINRTNQSGAGQTDRAVIDVVTSTGAARFSHYNPDSAATIGEYRINRSGTLEQYVSSNLITTTDANGFRSTALGITNTSGTSGKGISLYGGHTSGQPTYGLMFAGISTFGSHGAVSADWATYFVLNNTAGRGWIFKGGTGSAGNVASISNTGQANFVNLVLGKNVTSTKTLEVIGDAVISNRPAERSSPGDLFVQQHIVSSGSFNDVLSFHKAAVKVTEVICTADVSGSLNGKYIRVYGQAVSADNLDVSASAEQIVDIWFNVNGAGTVPASGAGSYIQVPLATNATAATVANAIETALKDDPAFSAFSDGVNSVYISSLVAKTLSDSTAGTSGFTVNKITDGTTNITGTSKYIGGVLAPNGKIYFIPYSATTVMVIDPNTDKIYTFGSISGSAKYIGGVLAPNGKIYCIPFNATNVLVIDPATDTTSTFGSLSGSNKWRGGVLSPNGKIYGVPYTSDKVLVIDPDTNTADTFGSLTTTTAKWQGGVIVGNKIYCCPCNSANVLIIDTTIHKTKLIGSLTTSSNKWNSGVLSNTGKVYFMPFSSTSVLTVDTLNNDTIATFGNISGSNKYAGAVLSLEGEQEIIYGIPYAATSILRIKIVDEAISYILPTSGTNKWWGGVLAPNGKIYCVPMDSLHIGVITIGNSQSIRPLYLISAYYNKY